MPIFAQKQNLSQKPVSSSLAPSNRRTDLIPNLQRAIGNQAVQRFIQRKLTINTPGDRYEQEADHVADQVMRMSASPCACGASCPKCKQEGGGQLQMKRLHEHDTGNMTAPPSVNELISSPGHPLDLPTRQFMETRFGHDFSGVRVHADAKASDLARQIDALAYTAGRDIVFAAGRYDTASASGQRLLAHELAHVVQQTGGASRAIQRQPAPEVGAESFQLSPFRPDDPRADASPLVASALGSTVIDGFATGSANIPKGGDDTLRFVARQIVFFIAKYPRSTVQITGHTDRVDSKENNIKLGQKRADAVSAFLKDEGVPAHLIGTDSKGESDPMVPTADEKGESRNRRVHVFFRVGRGAFSLGADVSLTPPSPPEPEPSVKFDLPTDYDPDKPRPPYRNPKETELTDKMDKAQKRAEEIEKKRPKNTKTPAGVVIDKVMDDVVNPVIKKLPIPEKWKKKAEKKVREGLESGTEKACEAGIDLLEIGSGEKDVLKATCKSALKYKPGDKSNKE